MVRAQRQLHGPDHVVTYVPEYGYVVLQLTADEAAETHHRPFPYHPVGSTRDFTEVADTEGVRLQALSEEAIPKDEDTGRLAIG